MPGQLDAIEEYLQLRDLVIRLDERFQNVEKLLRDTINTNKEEINNIKNVELITIKNVQNSRKCLEHDEKLKSLERIVYGSVVVMVSMLGFILTKMFVLPSP
ncbi:MAG: hypothetical protein HQK79_14130 [Desulfobacterales bacterium]|nr:hypothetical protein [Desulfobacterales bacterium]MBF0396698.1 hypothetical protein [Desulfobacterales bacterium]